MRKKSFGFGTKKFRLRPWFRFPILKPGFGRTLSTGCFYNEMYYLRHPVKKVPHCA